MGSICLSSASILRCASLTQLENILLIIPTALEVIFSTSLIFAKWGRGRRHWFLAAEGWTYFALVIVEMLSEIVPAVRSDLSIFRAFDLGIGVASFLPIFFYTFFLFLFTRGELANTLPQRLQSVAKLTLLVFIPPIVIFNEIASFIGITIRKLPSLPKGNYIIGVGFTNQRQEGLWTFFTSLTLALLTAYQATLFSLAFFRLVQVLLHQRRIEDKGSDKAHFINGIGWISAAAKLGALETVIGFGGGGFGMALTRRIMRLLSRACMCFGVIKGVDAVEDFQIVRSEILNNRNKDFRQSRLRHFISNPRFSTFRQLSPTATGFHSTTRAPTNVVLSSNEKEKLGRNATQATRQSMLTLKSGLPGMDHFADVKDKESKKLVTVVYKGGPPTLQMRFSMLNFPSPAKVVERQKSTWYESSDKSRYTQSSYYFDSEKANLSNAELQPPMPNFHQEMKPASDGGRESMNSIPSLNGPFEIVTGTQQNLSQKTAQARIYQAVAPSIYQAPTINNTPTIVHNVSPETMAVMAFPEPITDYSNSPAARQPVQTDPSRVKSMASVKSIPDSLQAVHDLADQFPGPPSFQYIPEDKEPRDVWEDDSPSSVVYPPGIMVAQVISSPSELLFKERDRQRPPQTPSAVDDDVTWGNGPSQVSTPAFAAPSPVRAGKVPVSQPGGYRVSGTPRSKLPGLPVSAPVEKPVLEALKLPVTVPQRGRPSVPESPEGVTPATGISGFSQFAVVQDPTTDTDDPFLDLGMALDTGKSRQFRPMQSSIPAQQTPTATTPRKGLPKDEKLSRIAEWVDTSASVAVAQLQVEAEMPARDNSLQNLHDRGTSIDNLVIPWLKRDLPSSAKRPVQPSRVKSVGKAPIKATPAPIQVGPMRGSLYLQPITIPPRDGNMPRAVQIEYGSLESTGRGGKGILRDSEVLGIEDSARIKQKKQEVKYF